MQFELSEALLDDILFSMEDQEFEFYIDCLEGIVVSWDDCHNELDDDKEDRFISLPEWHSSDGFRLMEKFTAGFKNPIIRGELYQTLNQGRGVFRAFKDTISRHPEAEKLWFSFKEKEMKNEIIRWYNALREEWGLKKIGPEPEETSDLVLEDFRFRDAESDKEVAAGSGMAVVAAGSIAAMIAETASGEAVGFISAIQVDNNLLINYLEIKPEYRGLGLGKTLLNHFLKKLESIKHESLDYSKIYIDLPVEHRDFSRALIREGFEEHSIRYCLSDHL